jgi:transcriptional regulator with XRE-family HTH domain
MDVGREIRRRREAKGWSQAKLAAAADMGVSGVSQIETGTRNPSAITLEKLAGALGLEVADLFPKAEEPLPFEEKQRRQSVYLSWLEFVNRYADRWEEKIRRGGLDRGALYEFRDTHYDLATTTNLLWQEELQGLPDDKQDPDDLIMSKVISRQLKLMTSVLEAAQGLFQESEFARFKRGRETTEEWRQAANE